MVDGLGAIKVAHRGYFEIAVRPAFADSLDLDEALKQGHEQENRWDYLLGHSPSGDVVAVEPHSAKPDEITTVIKKRSAAAHFALSASKPAVPNASLPRFKPPRLRPQASAARHLGGTA